jgi:ABC-type proline/glycine betaine transport system ATPase subunit
MRDEFLRSQEMLHKTIRFVTHSLDETPRLADRIAIVQDGFPIPNSPHQLKQLKMKLLILLIL